MPRNPTGRQVTASLAAAVVAGAALVTYAAVVERNRFTLRRVSMPVLAAGTPPMTVLHLSDLHMVPGQRRKREWVRRLADYRPDLVVTSGDTLTWAESVPAALDALDPLLDRPGVFVMGNNDYYQPVPKSPLTYFDPEDSDRHGPELPWRELSAALRHRGWLDLDNRRETVHLPQGRVAVTGLDDPHLGRDRFDAVSGRADPDAALRLAVLHAPQPTLLDSFAAEGYDLALAGHTHGGQVRLPGFGAAVTNCHIDRRHARGAFPWPDPGGRMRVNVSAGLGTSPYAPVRLFCPPEATLLTLVARDSR